MTLSVNLSGRRILVTGASSGLGAAICRSLVMCGATIAMLARRKDRLEELEREFGGRAFGFATDVTNLETLASSVGDAAKRLGGLDGVIAAAGRGMAGTIATGTPSGWRELMDLNLVAPLATVRYALTHFSDTGRRDIVIIGSAAGNTPMKGVGIYAASKRGLKAAFDSLRLELAQSGVSAGFIMPGAFETEGLIGAVAINGEIPAMDAPLFVPRGQPGPPKAVADTVVFMLSLPDGVAINEVVIRPTSALNP